MRTASHRPPDQEELGRFDRSFFFHLVGSFLILTLALVAVELGLRLAVVLYRFDTDAPKTAQEAAQGLAADVRAIMLNRGGPVAARTVYPIIDRNFQRAGLEIAIEPSPVTVAAVESVFGFTPRGIPAEWPAGRHAEATTVLRADEFCLQCHVGAAVGDVLGTVVVRDYLGTRLGHLWGEVRLTGTLNLIKVVLHAVILFFLLRKLMAPLLALGAAVARLARGEAGVSVRVEVVSSDEFGALAHDLNVFLDRIDQILSDLEETISGLVEVGSRLERLTTDAADQVVRLEKEALETGSTQLVHDVHEVRHTLNEIKDLERRMGEVAKAGRRLLTRLMRAGAPTTSATGTGGDSFLSSGT